MKKRMIGCLLLCGVLALSACGKKAAPAPAETTQKEAATEAAAASGKDGEEVSETKEVSESGEQAAAELVPIDFVYTDTKNFRLPEDASEEAQVVGYVDGVRVTTPGYEALNAQLEKLEEKMADEVTQEYTTFFEFLNEEDMDEYTLSMLPFYTEETVWMTRADSRLFGLLYHYSSFAGGAHPYSCAVSYHFDPATGKELKLCDISSNPEMFLKQILRRLNQHDEVDFFFEDYEETAETAFTEGDLCWMFDEEGLRILFNPYDIGPYAMGVVEISFTYGELRPLIFWEYLLSSEEVEKVYPSLRENNGMAWDNTDDEYYEEETYLDPRLLVNYSDPEYVFPESDSRLLTDADVEGMSLYEVRRGLNELYARHGRVFNGGAMARYFESRLWYEGTVRASDFDDAVFTEIEHKNVDFLAAKLNKLSAGKNVAETESKVRHFLLEEGVNGLLRSRFEDLQVDAVRVYDIIYQLADEEVDWEALYKGIEASGEAIETDVSAVTSLNLDRLLRRITGYGIAEANWDFTGQSYYEPLATYYIQHGDTNYMPVETELMNVDGKKLDVICYSEYTYDGAPFVVTLEETKGSYRILSVRELAMG